MTGSADRLVTVYMILFNQFVHKQAFQHVVTFRGILSFEQPPVLTVLIRNIGKQDCPCHNQPCLIRYIGRLGLH